MLPDSGLCFVHDPDDAFEHMHALRSAAEEDPTCLFVPITPIADNVRTLGGDILTALGKESSLAGSGRSGRERWLRALLWLQVSEVRTIYVSRAHLLKPWLLEHLIGAACLCNVRLILIFQSAALRRSQQQVLDDWPITKLTIEELLGGKGRKPKRQQPKEKRPVVKRLPAVPVDNFTSFRAAARGHLSDHDFAAVDAVFLDAVEQTSAYLAQGLDVSDSALCEHLRELIADSDWMPDILTRLRGSQVAAFHAGLLVRANLDVLAATRTPRARLEPETLAVIEQYETPRLTALMLVLTATALPLAAIQTIVLADIAGDGQQITIGGDVYRLDPRAAALVDVLVRERLAYFAQDSDPLFIFTPGTGQRHGPKQPWTIRGMSDALKRVERESNLMLTTHLVDAGQRDAVAWARRRGISLQKI